MSNRREISTFQLNPAVLSKLMGAGFTMVSDFMTIKPSELSTAANITPSEALYVLKTLFEDVNTSVRKAVMPTTKTALELLQEEQELGSIVTFSERLDDMLGGGVPLCKITEFCGAPGIGKTQICMQLAVDTQIPENLGGLESEVVYIDTEGSFIVERLADIAEATVKHCQNISPGGEAVDCLSVEKVLAGIHYFRCHDHIELIATVHLLPKFLKQNKKVKLIVIDSIACPFRHNFDDMSLRTRLLTTLAQNFIKLATQFKVAVVLTNQMTTKIGAGSSHLVPALGESWGHASTLRVILFWEHNLRRALLYKSPSKQETSCAFQVTLGGIRDIQQESAASSTDTETGTTGGTEKSSFVDRKTPLSATEKEKSDQPSKKQRVV